jgi:hypothetical protein
MRPVANADHPLVAEIRALLHKLEEHHRQCAATGCLACWYADTIRQAIYPDVRPREEHRP